MMEPHVLMVTFAGQGSINPFARFAKILVANGLSVTFTITEEAGNKMIGVGGLDFIKAPNFQVEFISDGGSVDGHWTDLNQYVVTFNRAAPLSFELLLRKLAVNGRPITYIITNPFIPWASRVASSLGIPCALLWPESACVFAAIKRFIDSKMDLPQPGSTIELPGLPPLTLDDLPVFLLPNNPLWTLTQALQEQFRALDGLTCILANTFNEVEHETLRSLPMIKPIGPFISSDDHLGHVSGDLEAIDEGCLDWLCTKPAASVVYVSLGSFAFLSDKQMEEMAFGLELTGMPFLWVVKPPRKNWAGSTLPSGFLERVGDMGMVVTWCPQTRVLSHPSVGCFLTHCGWNSTTETIGAGLPVVGFPQNADQPMNIKLLEIRGMGLRLVKGSDGIVERHEIARKVKEVTQGEKTAMFKENAMKWKNAARGAIGEGGSSSRNILDFVEDVRCRSSSRGKQND